MSEIISFGPPVIKHKPLQLDPENGARDSFQFLTKLLQNTLGLAPKKLHARNAVGSSQAVDTGVACRTDKVIQSLYTMTCSQELSWETKCHNHYLEVLFTAQNQTLARRLHPRMKLKELKIELAYKPSFLQKRTLQS